MELLKTLYKISSPSKQEDVMISVLKESAEKLGCKTEQDERGNLYITKGESETYPCLVAHVDEVCPNRSKDYEVIVVNDDLIFGYSPSSRKFEGIGGDDKNGIWICLKCLSKYKTLKVAFFVSEEIGCVGSANANLEWFKDCRWIVQCDRKGNSDLVTSINGNKICSKSFAKILSPKKFGFTIAAGGSTDVGKLKNRGLDLCCVNMSVGYYDPHEEHEHTSFNDLKKTLRYVQYIIENITKVYRHKQDIPKVNTSWYNCNYSRRTLRIDRDSAIIQRDRAHTIISIYCADGYGMRRAYSIYWSENYDSANLLTISEFEELYNKYQERKRF